MKKRILDFTKSKRILLPGLLLVIMLTIFSAIGISAQAPTSETTAGYYSENGEITSIIPGEDNNLMEISGLTLSDIEKRFPTDPDNIVHRIPSCPVIIDGIPYESQQISLFNGQRLYFIADTDGRLYAFTSAKDMEQFQSELVKSSSTDLGSASQGTNDSVSSDSASISLSLSNSIFFQNTYYTGNCVSLAPGYGLLSLTTTMNKAISSVQVSSNATSAYLYDQTNFTGNCFVLPSGCNYAMLSSYGWDNRASSIMVNN